MNMYLQESQRKNAADRNMICKWAKKKILEGECSFEPKAHIGSFRDPDKFHYFQLRHLSLP